MEKEPYRFYIKTCTLLGVNAVTTHEELTTAYGPHALSYSAVQRWVKFFSAGNMEIEDEPRSGRPITKTTSENIELVRKVIKEDPHCSYEDIEAETLLSHGTINRIIHEHLNKKKLLLVGFLIN